jgi:hypothetical protein
MPRQACQPTAKFAVEINVDNDVEINVEINKA